MGAGLGPAHLPSSTRTSKSSCPSSLSDSDSDPSSSSSTSLSLGRDTRHRQGGACEGSRLRRGVPAPAAAPVHAPARGPAAAPSEPTGQCGAVFGLQPVQLLTLLVVLREGRRQCVGGVSQVSDGKSPASPLWCRHTPGSGGRSPRSRAARGRPGLSGCPCCWRLRRRRRRLCLARHCGRPRRRNAPCEADACPFEAGPSRAPHLRRPVKAARRPRSKPRHHAARSDAHGHTQPIAVRERPVALSLAPPSAQLADTAAACRCRLRHPLLSAQHSAFAGTPGCSLLAAQPRARCAGDVRGLAVKAATRGSRKDKAEKPAPDGNVQDKRVRAGCLGCVGVTRASRGTLPARSLGSKRQLTPTTWRGGALAACRPGQGAGRH